MELSAVVCCKGGIGRRSIVDTWSLIEMKRIVKRKVSLEIEESYEDGSSMSDKVEVRTTDVEDRVKSIEELADIAKKELKKDDK